MVVVVEAVTEAVVVPVTVVVGVVTIQEHASEANELGTGARHQWIDKKKMDTYCVQEYGEE